MYVNRGKISAIKIYQYFMELFDNQNFRFETLALWLTSI